jgi:hypothetical protein
MTGSANGRVHHLASSECSLGTRLCCFSIVCCWFVFLFVVNYSSGLPYSSMSVEGLLICSIDRASGDLGLSMPLWSLRLFSLIAGLLFLKVVHTEMCTRLSPQTHKHHMLLVVFFCVWVTHPLFQQVFTRASMTSLGVLVVTLGMLKISIVMKLATLIPSLLIITLTIPNGWAYSLAIALVSVLGHDCRRVV